MSVRPLLALASAALALAVAPAAAQSPAKPTPPGCPPEIVCPPMPGPGGLPPMPPMPGDGMPPLPDGLLGPPMACEPEGETELRPAGPPAICGAPDLGDLPSFKPAFLNRVWRFAAEVNSYTAESDVLSVTIGKVKNLPKRFRDQDDPILDADANVLLSGRTRVYDADGKRLPKAAARGDLLDVAEDVAVVGKLLPPWKWQTDEDDEPVVTIRAKRIMISG